MNTGLIAGNPLEPLPYNVIGNNERELVKKKVDWEISNQAPKKVKAQRLGESRRGKFPEMPCPLNRGEDIVYSLMKIKAAL